MENICRDVLNLCLADRPVPDSLLDQAVAIDDGRQFLSVVVEHLGDLFESRLCDVYADLFTRAIKRIAPDLRPRRAQSSPPPAMADRVYVLSRITLGADVAVTSVFLDAAKRRYPEAKLFFVGPRKNYGLFEADPRVQYQEAPYARSGALKDRLAASASLWFDDGIVLDPDSRLTQLGLLPVCPDVNYFYFESRSYGGTSGARLPDLAAQWFGDPQAKPYIAPLATTSQPAQITVSLGVGENQSKRLRDPFEADLLKLLASTGKSILVDLGGTPEERERVQRALQPGMRTHDGPFAPFAAAIAKSELFVGYDSAAGHVASACGIPLISIAAGFVSPRMQARWRPNGIVINTGNVDTIEAVRTALEKLK
ncbi:MAG: hypothetical protein ABI811_12265 [Acidobacteriota bacterium]